MHWTPLWVPSEDLLDAVLRGHRLALRAGCKVGGHEGVHDSAVLAGELVEFM